MDTQDAFRQAQDGFSRALQATEATQWGAPTPCTEWDVRALVNHVAGEMLWVPPLMAGQTVADVGDKFEGDILGSDPHATWSSAAAGAREAFEAVGAMAATAHLSFGDFSGNDYCWQLIADLLVHSWDLARGVGADDSLPADLSEGVYQFMAPMLASFGPNDFFASSIDVPAGAAIQERLLGLTGRRA